MRKAEIKTGGTLQESLNHFVKVITIPTLHDLFESYPAHDRMVNFTEIQNNKKPKVIVESLSIKDGVLTLTLKKGTSLQE